MIVFRQNHVNFLVHGKTKIKLFDPQGWYFLKNNIVHNKLIRKIHNL